MGKQQRKRKEKRERGEVLEKRCTLESFTVDTRHIMKSLRPSDHSYQLKSFVVYPGSSWLPKISIPYVHHSDQWARNTYDIRKYARFRAQFAAADASTDPSCCEFRQFVRGGFYLWGIRIPQPMANGATLHPTEWQEDSSPDGKRYGHRSDPDSPNDGYFVNDRATGRVYVGSDNPGMSCIVMGTPYKIELYFMDMIIDTCADILFEEFFKEIKTWEMVTEGDM